jgi:AraC-like DNA-binding protein
MSISSTRVERAEIRFHEAAPPLRDLVGCFWVVTAGPDARVRVVPDGSTAILIGFAEDRSSGWLLRGPLVRPDERRYAAPTTMVGIRLRPGVAFLLSAIPAHTIVGRRIALDRIAAFRDLVAEELDPSRPERCIEVLQRFLLQRLAQARLHDTVAAALREIERAHGGVRIPALAARCGVSARHLHRLMRTWVGYGAKGYASVIRFQATLHEMDDTRGATAADLAAENGYYDQAHLTADLGRFAGATPGRLASTGVADFSKTRCDDLP